jgi:serine/threonine protein kinase
MRTQSLSTHERRWLRADSVWQAQGCLERAVRWVATPRGCAVDQHGFLRGSVIYFGKYELLSRINIGGMAEIVKARDTSVPRERLVAIKRILPHLCDDQQYRAMFLDESRVLAQLEHASIIEAFEIGEIDDTPYIALEYIHGQDARALFHETRRGEQRIPIAIACHIVARVCEGLHHAHEQTDANGQLLGIVHRDVSLQNILLSYDGDVKLTDFGIAVSAENVARTDLGVVKGKFGYMSPEQIKGAALDRRSDVFAAGICLYELLTGERLFSGENDYKAVERVRNVDFEPPSALNRQIPSRLERVVMKALAKHPRDRYQSTNDLRRALQSFMAEANEFVSSDDLGAYMRDTFAKELSGQAPSAGRDQVTAAHPIADPITGLNAFDHLEPVSSIGFTEHVEEVTAVGPGVMAVGPAIHTVTLRPPGISSPAALGSSPRAERDIARPAPSVPPLIPRSNSIPASAPRVTPTSVLEAGAPVQRFDMDWDEEEPTTVSQGFQDIPKLPAVRSEQITRPTRAAASTQERTEARAAPTPDAQASGPYSRSMSTLEMAKPPSLISPMLVAGVFGIAALVLIVYLTRDHGVATLRLETEPKDAVVSVDGQHASGIVSPFVISELAAGVNHTILVEKPGYVSWSTRLRVRADKTFELPLVKLEPLQASAAPGRASPASIEASPEPTAAVSPTRAVSSGPSSNTEAAQARREAAAARRAERAQSRRARSHDVPADAFAIPAATQAPAKGGMGTLRINTRPWSQISIDGRPAGNTPQMNLQLKAGSHSVTLTNPDFGVSKTVVIDIKPDATVTRVLTLVP